MRNLAIGEATWQFTVGRSHVRIIDPNGKGHVVACHDVVGCDPDVYERGQWKGTSDGMVTPGRVREYIEANLKTT